MGSFSSRQLERVKEREKKKKAVKVNTTWSGGTPEEVVFEQLGWFLCSCV